MIYEIEEEITGEIKIIHGDYIDVRDELLHLPGCNHITIKTDNGVEITTWYIENLG